MKVSKEDLLAIKKYNEKKFTDKCKLDEAMFNLKMKLIRYSIRENQLKNLKDKGLVV
jgi:hypothetical protein